MYTDEIRSMSDVDWNDIDDIRSFFQADRFASEAAGAVIEWAKNGEALCSLKIGPIHKNAAGILQGGVSFTLADFAFAVAANQTHPVTVSLNNQIAFLKPPKGTTLYAHAKEISAGKSTCYYEVDVADELQTKVAHMTVNGFIRPPK